MIFLFDFKIFRLDLLDVLVHFYELIFEWSGIVEKWISLKLKVFEFRVKFFGGII